MRGRWMLMFIVIAVVAGSSPTDAAQEEVAPPRDFPLDPVFLVSGEEVAGKPDLTVSHGGFLYHFASEENKATFEREPARYEIQMGGACGSMGELAGDGRSELFAVWDEHIYLFASPGCRARFLKTPERLVMQPDAAPVSHDEAAIARGRECLDRAVEVLGGIGRVDAIATYREARNWMEESGGTRYRRRTTLAFTFPDSLATSDEWNEWKSGCEFDGAHGWFVNGDGHKTEMEPARRDYLARTLMQHPLAIVQQRDAADLVIVHAGEEDFATGDGATTLIDLVGVSRDGVTTTLGIERSTGRILLARYRSRGPGAYVGQIETIYSDFRDVDGIALPHRVAVSFDGEPVAEYSGPLSIEITMNEASDSDRSIELPPSSQP